MITRQHARTMLRQMLPDFFLEFEPEEVVKERGCSSLTPITDGLHDLLAEELTDDDIIDEDSV